MILWFTGQPGSGKTTLAKEIIKRFNNDKVIHIDGDDLRDVLDNIVNNSEIFDEEEE